MIVKTGYPIARLNESTVYINVVNIRLTENMFYNRDRRLLCLFSSKQKPCLPLGGKITLVIIEIENVIQIYNYELFLIV